MKHQTISEKGIAVITGASSGLGAVYADRLAKRGYDLKLVARRGARLAALAQQLNKEYGVIVEPLVADLGNPTDLERVANSIKEDQRITILINNAGTVTIAPLSQTSVEDSAAMIDVNITAVVQLTQAVLGRFKEKDQGTIVNIGSVLGFRSLPNFSVYSGTKGFVSNFTLALQEEFAKTKVRVQLVLPATTSTEIWDVGGVPLSTFDPSIVMSAENCVDAALVGLDRGELVTLPSVENMGLWNDFETAGQTLFNASGNNKPAARYVKSQ
jgi:short-subunit dehydrogenase